MTYQFREELIGPRIKQIREAKKIRQKDLSDLTQSQ